MSLHYLLDGYNILKQIPSFRDLPLEDGRRGFLSWIENERPQGSLNNPVIVVFDGQAQYSLFPGSHPGDSLSSQGGIRVIFSDGCTADDKIKLMVEEDADHKNCVVVSDDKDIYLYARSLGARVLSVKAFTTKSKEIHGRHETGGKYISLSRQEKINKELSGIWLKEKL